jgi:hypothetical protein
MAASNFSMQCGPLVAAFIIKAIEVSYERAPSNAIVRLVIEIATKGRHQSVRPIQVLNRSS